MQARKPATLHIVAYGRRLPSGSTSAACQCHAAWLSRCGAMRGAVLHTQARSTQTGARGHSVHSIGRTCAFAARRHDADAQRIRTGGDKFYVRIVNQSEQAPRRAAARRPCRGPHRI